MEALKHWTAQNPDKLAFRISSDFIAQLQTRLEKEGTKYSELAKRIRVTLGYVSQVFNNPGNLTLRATVKFAGGVGMKVAVVAYDDQDPLNNRGPVNSEIFSECWKRAGSPRDFYELANCIGAMRQVGVAPPVRGDLTLYHGSSANHAWSHCELNPQLIATANSGVVN